MTGECFMYKIFSAAPGLAHARPRPIKMKVTQDTIKKATRIDYCNKCYEGSLQVAKRSGSN